MTERQFPVLRQGDEKYKAELRRLDCPRTVPWDFIVQYREGCLSNHDQTPERLAERGGLGPEEILAVINGSADWKTRTSYWRMPPEKTVPMLKEMIDQWRQAAGTKP